MPTNAKLGIVSFAPFARRHHCAEPPNALYDRRDQSAVRHFFQNLFVVPVAVKRALVVLEGAGAFPCRWQVYVPTPAIMATGYAIFVYVQRLRWSGDSRSSPQSHDQLYLTTYQKGQVIPE